MDLLTAMPASFAAGTTVSLQLTIPDYPASEYDLTVYLAGRSRIHADIESGVVKSGDDFLVTLTAALTAPLLPGRYEWEFRVKVGATAYLRVDAGTVLILPDIAQATDGSLQTHAERMLALVEAALEGRLTRDQESIIIDGVAITRIPHDNLRRLRILYLAEVESERNPANAIGSIHVHFNRPGAD
jgi:hypothetical protein